MGAGYLNISSAYAWWNLLMTEESLIFLPEQSLDHVQNMASLLSLQSKGVNNIDDQIFQDDGMKRTILSYQL